MFRQEQQKVLIISVFSCIDLVIITDFINPVTKPDEQMSSSITYNVGGMSIYQEICYMSNNLVYLLFNFLVFISNTIIFAYPLLKVSM